MPAADVDDYDYALNDSTAKLYKAGVDKIDYHVPERYDRADLERLLQEGA